MSDVSLPETISEFVWQVRYRGHDATLADEASMAASWERVALALSKPEQHHRDDWRDRFEQILSHGRFLPGGRILAGAGSVRRTTMFNCFATGTLQDALDGIFSVLGESMVTMQAGGAIGCDFSTLRPAGARAVQSGNIASGPVSFMQAVDEDAPWPLVFPLAGHAVPPDGIVCERQWSGASAPEP